MHIKCGHIVDSFQVSNFLIFTAYHDFVRVVAPSLSLSLFEYEVNQDVNCNECVWLRILLRDFVFNVSLQAHILSNNVGVTSPTRTFSSQKKNNILSYHLTFGFEIL